VLQKVISEIHFLGLGVQTPLSRRSPGCWRRRWPASCFCVQLGPYSSIRWAAAAPAVAGLRDNAEALRRNRPTREVMAAFSGNFEAKRRRPSSEGSDERVADLGVTPSPGAAGSAPRPPRPAATPATCIEGTGRLIEGTKARPDREPFRSPPRPVSRAWRDQPATLLEDAL